MSPDRIEGAPEPKPTMVNPFREPDNEGRYKVASMVAAVYRSKNHIATNSVIDGSLKNVWNPILNSGFKLQRANVGIKRMQELLDHAAKTLPSAIQPETIATPSPEFTDPEVKSFLLDLFTSDSRITAISHEQRLQQVFHNLALDLFGPSAFPNPQKPRPENDRMKRMELFFTHEPLQKAVEFFLIEPSLLPPVPTRPQDEK